MSDDQEIRRLENIIESLKADKAKTKGDLIALQERIDAREVTIRFLEEKLKRRPMPETRDSRTHKVEVTTKDGVVDVYVIVGFYEDGKPGEIFVRCSTMGSTVSGFVDSWSIAVSLLLQHGVPLEKVVEKFAHSKFEPLGQAKSGEVKFQASSLIDAIVRFLGNRYLGQELR